MGWSIGYDNTWKRDIGYGVPAYCDYPGCGEYINRGLAHVCGRDPYGGEYGCGLYFCQNHLTFACYDAHGELTEDEDKEEEVVQSCERCATGDDPFVPTPDHPEWMTHKITDESWQQWRDENPKSVAAINFVLRELKEGNETLVVRKTH